MNDKSIHCKILVCGSIRKMYFYNVLWVRVALRFEPFSSPCLSLFTSATNSMEYGNCPILVAKIHN